MLETGRDVTDKLLRSMALAAMVLAGACDRRRPGTTIVPTAPTVPQAPAVPTVTLSGTVVERFSGQPIQGALVGLWPRTYPANRSWNWHAASEHVGRRGPLQDHGHRSRFRVLLALRDHATRFVAVHATVRDHGHIGRRWESGCHADIPRESRRRQFAPAAARARHTDRFGRGLRSHRDGSAAGRRRVGGMGRRHGSRRRPHIDRHQRSLLALRVAGNPAGFTVCIEDRIFARWFVQDCRSGFGHRA